ncbi:MAG TPA: hypothetical protein PK636_03410, partial [bacterium]|nr:hypothetical protein [bacterium]
MKHFRAITLIAILLLAGFLRFSELGTFGPTPGDDISYLNGVRDTYAGLRRAIPSPPWWFVPLRPFFVANNLTQRTYEGMMCFTSQAKPLYLLKLSLIEGAGTLTLYGMQFANAVSGLLVVLVLFFLVIEIVMEIRSAPYKRHYFRRNLLSLGFAGIFIVLFA